MKSFKIIKVIEYSGYAFSEKPIILKIEKKRYKIEKIYKKERKTFLGEKDIFEEYLISVKNLKIKIFYNKNKKIWLVEDKYFKLLSENE